MARVDDCIAEVAKLLGRERLTDKEAEAIFGDLQKALDKRKRTNPGESFSDLHAKAAKDFEVESVAQAIIEKRNAAINAGIRMIQFDFIKTQFKQNPFLGFEASWVGVNAKRPSGRRSAYLEQRTLAQEYGMGFIADMERHGFWQDFIAGHLDEEIHVALFKFGDEIEPGVRGETSDLSGFKVSKEAEQMAEIIHKWQEKTRLDGNKAGAWTGSLPGYITNQSHDMFKLRRAGYDEWKTDMEGLLHERSFDGVKNRDEFYQSAYDGLASGVHLSHAEGAAIPSGHPKGQSGSVAKRMSENRLFHFKGGREAFQYSQKYGVGSLRESLMFGFERTAQRTGLMRVWGTNPHNNFEMVWEKVMASLDSAGRAKLRNKRGAIDNRIMEVDGSINIPGNQMVAKWGAGIRAVQSMAKLGGAVISAVSDVAITARTLKYNGVPFLQSYADALSGVVKGRGSQARRDIIAMIAVQNDGAVGSMIQRFSGADDVPGMMSRALRMYFKFNLLTPWTDGMRRGAGLGLARNLAMNSDRAWSGIAPELRDILPRFGIDDGKWEMMRQVGVREADGTGFLVPEGARDIPSAQLKSYLERFSQTPTAARIRDLRIEIETDFRSYYVDMMDHAVIVPDARTNAILRQGTRPGTVLGEVMRFWAQFKSFPTAILHKSVGREVFGRGADLDVGVFKALRSGNGEFSGLMSFIVQTTILGYIAMSAKDMAKGRTPRDPTDVKTWIAAMTQGGGAGIYGDFLFGEARSRFGRSAFETGLGPTYGLLADVYDIWIGMKNGDLKAARLFNMLLNNLPWANLFYTRIAMDYAFLYELRESLSPGFLRRMEKRIKEQNGQEFFLRPSEFVR